MDRSASSIARREAFVLMAFLGILALTCFACPPPATVQTPAGKTAFAADQVLQRVEELQNAAIAANVTIDAKTGLPGLSTSTTRAVVTYCVAAAKTLKASPAGWQATVTTGFSELRGSLSAEDAQRLGPYLAALDAALAGLASGGGAS